MELENREKEIKLLNLGAEETNARWRELNEKISGIQSRTRIINSNLNFLKGQSNEIKTYLEQPIPDPIIRLLTEGTSTNTP